MGTYISNKFAPVTHSSDDDSGVQSDDDEGTRAAKRRKKILDASRKKINSITKKEGEAAEESRPRFPRASIEWECSMNPDPYFRSCSAAQEAVQPTYSLVKYATMRPSAPWNYAGLGLAPITDESYKMFFRDTSGRWSKFETLALLEALRDNGMDGEAVWKEVAADPLLRLRHADHTDCQHRFLTILALASIYGQSLTMKSSSSDE